MFHLYKNIQTDFLGQIFLELFQFKTHFFGTPRSAFESVAFGLAYKIGQSQIRNRFR